MYHLEFNKVKKIWLAAILDLKYLDSSQLYCQICIIFTISVLENKGKVFKF